MNIVINQQTGILKWLQKYIVFKRYIKEYIIIYGSSSFGYFTVNYESANVSNDEKAAV